MHPLAFVGGDRHHQARDQLRADEEDDQGDQSAPAAFAIRSGMKRKDASPPHSPRLAADVVGQLAAVSSVEEGDEDRQLGEQRDAGGKAG